MLEMLEWADPSDQPKRKAKQEHPQHALLRKSTGEMNKVLGNLHKELSSSLLLASKLKAKAAKNPELLEKASCLRKAMDEVQQWCEAAAAQVGEAECIGAGDEDACVRMCEELAQLRSTAINHLAAIKAAMKNISRLH